MSISANKNVSTATAGREYGGAQQAGRANSLQSARGPSRSGVGASALPSTLGNRQPATPRAGA